MSLAIALSLVFLYTHPTPATVALIDAAAHLADVPSALLVSVCYAESRLGTAPRYASLCGVRWHHVYVREDALSAHMAALSLARRRRECATWPRALAAYRYGRGCDAPDTTGYVRRALDLQRRIERARGAS